MTLNPTESHTVPAEAKAFVNFRLLPGDTIADVLWHIKKTIMDDRVKVKPVEGKFNEALPTSSTKSQAYQSLKHVIRQVFDNPPVAPYVMLGGIDERIPITGMAKMVKFYAQLMQVWGTKEMALKG